MKKSDKVIEILKDLSGMNEVKPEAHLQKDLALDSMNMVVMLLEIEEAFGVKLDESDMNPFDLNTVQDVFYLVEKYGGE